MNKTESDRGAGIVSEELVMLLKGSLKMERDNQYIGF